MEDQKIEVTDQEVIEMTKITIQIHFSDKSVKECLIDAELLGKVATLIYELESKRDAQFKAEYEKGINDLKK